MNPGNDIALSRMLRIGPRLKPIGFKFGFRTTGLNPFFNYMLKSADGEGRELKRAE